MQEYRALLLRSNRFLGSALVEREVISVDDLEKANEKFMTAIQSAELKRASILTTLLFEAKSLDENLLIENLVEEEGLGLIDLNGIDLHSLRPYNVDIGLCWATWTIPFDKIGDTYMLATCYYLSAPVVKHWKELLDGRVIWYGTSMLSMTRALERIEEIHEVEDAASEDE